MRHVVANFAAVETIVLPILPQAAIIGALADGAVLLARAAFFFVVAHCTAVSVSHDAGNVTRIDAAGKITLDNRTVGKFGDFAQQDLRGLLF